MKQSVSFVLRFILVHRATRSRPPVGTDNVPGHDLVPTAANQTAEVRKFKEQYQSVCCSVLVLFRSNCQLLMWDVNSANTLTCFTLSGQTGPLSVCETAASLMAKVL